ncbi:hypothetical protein FRC03_009057 [Tulasnella sp. 419]|nr:hypothetical protein FRC02_001077 [Tulasnella sp. 418]KAG8967922.1 hypothetical protein FRC03_009057 [Tulasnella sp. 419]
MQSLFRPTIGTLARTQCRPPVSRLIQSANARAAFRPNSTFSGQRAFTPRAGWGAYGMSLGVGAVGLGLSMYPKLNCEPGPPATEAPHGSPKRTVSPPVPAADPKPSAAPTEPTGPPPTSSIDPYQLTFGTVCGICSGVFVKKGIKTLAFILGGVFVILQYFSSTSLIRVDWGKLSSKYERHFHTQPAKPGEKSRPPTVYSFFNWFVDFLTADFPPRATFIAGFILGLRLG